MNTTGFIRGYMSKGMRGEEFIKVVVRALGREFEEEIKIDKINSDDNLISMNEYSVIISDELIEDLKSPYGIDRFILEEFEKQGFVLDNNRSQYIEYCFGNYVGAEVISVE